MNTTIFYKVQSLCKVYTSIRNSCKRVAFSLKTTRKFDKNMTWKFSSIFPITFLWHSCYFLTTFLQLFYEFSTAFTKPSYNFPTFILQFLYGFFTSFLWLSYNYSPYTSLKEGPYCNVLLYFYTSNLRMDEKNKQLR